MINNNAIPVLADSDGQLGTNSSSRRFKKEIQPKEQTSEAILALKPMTFHYKNDRANRPEFGLIAEEVAEVNPDLVVRDKSGEIYIVRYDAVNTTLLNEFLKVYKRIQDLEARDAQQQKQIEALTKQLKNRLHRSKRRVRSMNLANLHRKWRVTLADRFVRSSPRRGSSLIVPFSKIVRRIKYCFTITGLGI